jgi:hypothetical protein
VLPAHFLRCMWEGEAEAAHPVNVSSHARSILHQSGTLDLGGTRKVPGWKFFIVPKANFL